MNFWGYFLLINESRQSVMVQKPETPHLKGLLEEVDEPDGPLAGLKKEFVKLWALLMMSYMMRGSISERNEI
jgi:hypothetical protein